jgi:hypothetical protein
MDHIDEHLATAATEDNYPLAIKAALAIGKKTLNRYYDKTDHSEVFRIAMGKKFLAVFIYFYCTSLSFSSATPSSQARIFQERRMAG